MPPVTVQFLKNPDILHWGFEGHVMGDDQFGKWVGVPSGSPRWKGKEPTHPTREDAVFCVPYEDWWHLHYNGPTTKFSHFVDIVTPPQWVSNQRYEMIDLDLDVVVHRDGTVEVEDEDEFEIHQVRYGYTEAMISGAVESTAAVVRALQERQEPFFETAAAWLVRLRS